MDHDLAGSGRRVTSPRRAILAAIGRRPAGFTAEEISHLVPEVGRATVYRTLRLLLQLGLVCRVMRENGTPRYRLSRPGHHHHVVCVDCGTVRDFDACTVSALMQELTRQTGFDAVGHWLEVYGRCPACSAGQS